MNKLRIIALSVLFTLTAGFATAQEDTTASDGASDECKKQKSLYYLYLKQKEYNDASIFWNNAYAACGEEFLDAKFFYNGRYIYSMRIRGLEKDDPKAEELEDSLTWIYNMRMKYEYDPEWSLDAAYHLTTRKSEDTEALDSLFKNIHVMKENSKANHITAYFKHLILNKFNGAPVEEKEEVRTFIIEEYITLSAYVSKAITVTEAEGKDAKYYNSAQDFLDKYFLKIASDCSVLETVFEKKLGELPQEKEAKKKAVNNYLGLLDAKKCQTLEVYGKFVDTLIAIDPSPEAYYFGGTNAESTGNSEKALNYFEKALEMEADGPNKMKYLFAVGKTQYALGRYSTAFKTLKGVEGENKGEALYMCAGCISATANGCGESTFDRKANFWLANAYVNKAIAAGKQGVSSSQYLSNAPTKEECFNANKPSGSTVFLSCWGESVTIP